MAFDWKKFVMVFAFPALLIYGAVMVFPPILSPLIGPLAGQYTGAAASILTITGVLYVYKKFVAKKTE